MYLKKQIGWRSGDTCPSKKPTLFISTDVRFIAALCSWLAQCALKYTLYRRRSFRFGGKVGSANMGCRSNP